MSVTLDFLRHVLPEEGEHWYVSVAIREGEARQNFSSSIDALVRRIQSDDQTGGGVYFAVGGFREKGKRTQANSAGARSFWLDIDAGPGKAYLDATEAYEAVETFCRGTRPALPAPTYVASGTGLHCYWPLVACLDATTWKQYATGLKTLCAQHGLQADPSRTSDIASILRPPGTYNRKSGTPTPVQCGQLVGPYSLESFEALLDAAPEQKVSHSYRERSEVLAVGQRNARYVNGHSLTGRLSKLFVEQVRHSETIAEECSQLAKFRDDLGCIPEPLWYACLGVLGFAVDGDEFGHRWSSGYDGYTYEETQARLDRARSLSGATTCAHFHSLDPKTCEACPHWQKIKSPIVLGRVQEEGAESDVRAVRPLPGKLEPFGIDLPDLPPDYVWRNNSALVLVNEDNGGKRGDTLISSHPLYLHSIETGEVRGDFNYHFKQHIPHRGWSDVALPAAMLFSAAGHGELAKQGANIHDHPHFLRYVRQHIDMLYGSGSLSTKYEQFGWKTEDTEFLYGLTLYGKDGKHDVSGSDELQVRTSKRNEWVGAYSRGNLSAWTRAANSLFAAGCEAQSLALLGAFAAPLMRFQAGDEGGAIISLVTRKSGTGKSTALAGAASVWGKREGLGLTNADSKISKFLTLGALGNLPLVYDEIETKDPKIIRDFVENFTNGRDKMRATRTGSIAHTASTWQTVLISASNASLIDAMSTGNDIPALGRRILELPLVIPDALKHAIGDRLQQELTNNRGWAGDAYLTWLVQPDNLAWTKRALDHWTRQVWEETKLGPDYRFWVRLAGAVGVAGVIVRRLDLLEFSVERIMKWLLATMTEGGKTATLSADWPIHALGDFIDSHAQNTLTMAGPSAGGVRSAPPIVKPTRELMVRYEIQNRRLLIATAPLRDWLVRKEISFNEFVRLLHEMGACTDRQKQATLAGGTDFPSSRVMCVEIDMTHEKLQGTVAPKLNNVIPLTR